MITTDIIILSYKDEVEIKKCISSVEEHCTDYNLIIEDNNPPRPNRGFTKAVNDGIEKGRAPFVWLLNSDAVVLPGAQEALMYRFSYHASVGIVGSMQRDHDDMDIIRHGGTFPHPFPGGRHKGGRVSMGHCRIPEKQTWVNFASVMFRREMVEKIGPMDESMFLLYSDSDYCYHARSEGWEVWYEPGSQVLHRLNASSGVTEWHKKDMEAFMKKWGIILLPNNQFAYSEKFRNLDKLP